MKSNEQPTKPFLCSYHHDDAEWSIVIHAYDLNDAKARVAKMGFIHLDGELALTIPANRVPRWFPSAICRLRNWWSNL